MAEQRKYFSFHKRMDFERGVFENMRVEDDGLCAEALSYKDKSLFFSRILDAGEEKTVWHRLTLAAENEDAATYRISVYASDEPVVAKGGRQCRIEEILHDGELSSEEKIETFLPFLKKRASAGRDLWLHEVQGRYLWFVLEVFAQGRGVLGADRKVFKVREIMVHFPARSWMKYLPELYQEADAGQGFLERYLGIFQSLYEDINHAIDCVPEEFSIDAAQGDFLYFLASMLDWNDTYIWTNEQLRRLLKNVIMLYRLRGTRETVSWFLELYTGEKPYILEYHQLLPFRNDRRSEQLFLRLYGADPYVVNIFLRESAMPTEKEYKTILRMLDEIRPAQMNIRLVALKPYIFLDEHSYLGVNSVLGQYRDITLDGVLAVPFAVIGS